MDRAVRTYMAEPLPSLAGHDLPCGHGADVYQHSRLGLGLWLGAFLLCISLVALLK